MNRKFIDGSIVEAALRAFGPSVAPGASVIDALRDAIEADLMASVVSGFSGVALKGGKVLVEEPIQFFSAPSHHADINEEQINAQGVSDMRK